MYNPYDPVSGVSVGACSGYNTMMTYFYRRCVVHACKISVIWVVASGALPEHYVYMRAQDHTQPYGNGPMTLDTLTETKQRYVRKKIILPTGHNQREPIRTKMYIPIKGLERQVQLNPDTWGCTSSGGPPDGRNGFCQLGATYLYGTLAQDLTVRANVNIVYYCKLYGKRLNAA